MNAESRKDAASLQFGQYAVVREIGRGGMAVVYEGEHVELGKRAAVKVMFASLAASTTASARFLREARAVAQLRHPHIVDVFDMGTTDGTPFFVMELLEGSTLAALLVERGPLDPEQIAGLFLPVLSAVAAAHERGVIHRDLKPANIFLASRPGGLAHPMVLDFGISKVASDAEDPSLTRSESLIGTVHYMSPEQTRGGSTATALSDQYAIGVMLYECATGKRPFAGPSHYELMHAIVTAPVTPPSTVNPKLGPEFDEIVLRAMSRDPERRYPSVHALGDALLSFAGKVGWALWGREFAGNAALDQASNTAEVGSITDPDISAPRPAAHVPFASRPPPGARPSSHRKWVWLAGALGLYGVAVTLLFLARPHIVETREVLVAPPATVAPLAVAPPPVVSAEPSTPSQPVAHAGEAFAPDAAAHTTHANEVAMHPPHPPRAGGTKKSSPPVPTPSPEPSSPERGTNSALILP